MKNNPKKVIYTSSYDRGLEHLLEIWPEVKKAVPEAELHVYYGWTLFEKFYRNNPERMQWMANMNKMMEHEGITHHGRVSQPEIIEEMKKCGVWAYPTHFGEISCITAMKAQMLGCIPVVINYAALQTTVQHGIKIEGDIYDPDIKKLFTEELIKLLNDPDKQDAIRKKMVPWAKKHYTWARVAKQWSDDFKKDDLKEAIDTLMEHDKDLENYMPIQAQEKYGLKQTY